MAGPLAYKPTAIMGASPGNFGTVRAQLALRQMFISTDTDVVVKPELIVFRAHERFDGGGNLTDQKTEAVRAALRNKVTAAKERAR